MNKEVQPSNFPCNLYEIHLIGSNGEYSIIPIFADSLSWDKEFFIFRRNDDIEGIFCNRIVSCVLLKERNTKEKKND